MVLRKSKAVNHNLKELDKLKKEIKQNKPYFVFIKKGDGSYHILECIPEHKGNIKMIKKEFKNAIKELEKQWKN